jgi:uncharacterized protein (TIGR03546 family)
MIIKLINILNKDASPREIAGGMALGFIAGMTPLASLHNLVVLFLMIVLRVNITAGIFAVGVFSGVAYIFDPLSNKIGYALLTLPALKAFWTSLYNMPVINWSRFNNTLTLGSLVLSLVLFYPVLIALRWAVVKYREKVMAKIAKWRILTIWKGSSLYNLYSRFS